MKDLNEVTINLCKIKGRVLGIECAINALLSVLPDQAAQAFFVAFEAEAEAARTVALNAAVSDHIGTGLDEYLGQLLAKADRR